MLNNADRDLKYPADNAYRSLLATQINASKEDLFPVLGPDQLCDILKASKFENFSVGENFEHTKKGIFKLNLHIHTYDSDGDMSVESLLDQAVKYADSLAEPPFVFTISNHDVVNDTAKALKIIAKDPQKFRNIYFVPGIEITAKYENPLLHHYPLQLEILNYCVNPFDEKLLGYLAEIKEYNYKYAETIFERLRAEGFDVYFDGARKYHNLINIGVSAAFIPYMQDYLLEEARKVNFDINKVNIIFEEYNREYGTGSIPPKTPSMEEVFQIARSGLLGIAHPGRIQFYCNKEGVTNEQAMKALFDRFKSLGGTMAEINYQYPENFFMQISADWLDFIKQYSDQIGLYRSGGIDNHSSSLFVCRF